MRVEVLLRLLVGVDVGAVLVGAGRRCAGGRGPRRQRERGGDGGGGDEAQPQQSCLRLAEPGLPITTTRGAATRQARGFNHGSAGEDWALRMLALRGLLPVAQEVDAVPRDKPAHTAD